MIDDMNIVALLVLSALAASAPQALQAELSLTRTVQSQNLLPTVGDYIQYDVKVTNTGNSVIKEEMLWVEFTSAQGSDTSATFVVPEIAVGSSTQLHIGPLKLHTAGEHQLRLGMNNKGDPSLPNDVVLTVAESADSITAYSPLMSTTLPIGIILIAAGAGFIAWHFAKRRRVRTV